MDEQDPSADRLCRIDAAQEDVLKERPAQARTLMFSVDGKPGEQNRRDGSSAWLAFGATRAVASLGAAWGAASA